MFQTEPIQFLQSLATDWLTVVMVFISKLGYSSFYIPVLIFLTFGVSFRKGFLLTQMMMWVGIVTEIVKNLIALPRPADVDSAVKLIEDNVPNPTPFTGKGGAGFWALPDREAIEIIRAQPEWSFGLPSGHVSGAVTFWGGLSMLFRHPAFRTAAIVMFILMPLSRMYLGRHFLADVLGGFVVGAGFLIMSYSLFVRPQASGRLLNLDRLNGVFNARLVGQAAFLLLIPVVLTTLSGLVESDDAGRLFGLNAAFFMLALTRLPSDAGRWYKRMGRVVLAFALYLVASKLVGLVVDAIGMDEDSRWIEFLAAAIPTFVTIWGGVIANSRLGLFAEKAAS